MILSVHPEADSEFAAAVAWYDEQRIGLGDEFEQDVYDTFELILEQPNAWHRWPGLPTVRVFPLDRFPYLLPFVARESEVVVLAVAHAKRRPGYWPARSTQGG